MVKRSLQASLSGIQQAKQAFDCKGWTQENLAEEVGLKTRQPIWRFFTGQPVERHCFLEVCLLLGLDWREIAVNPPVELPEPVEPAGTPVADIDTLVQQVRLKRYGRIQDRCGTLHLLDISQLVRIDDLYIDVNVLEEIPSQQWLELSDLQRFAPDELGRFSLGEVSQSQIEGMGAVKIYSKLRILGNPGSGKTTFLNHLAIQCNRGHFAANRVPIFVTLRDFADESRTTGKFSLLSYIGEEFLTSGISQTFVLETLLREGRVLLLLDGLDEVLYQERKTVVKEIRRLSEKYQQNLFVVTCRTAAKALSLTRFTDVEIAPFTPDKINGFAQKWFTTLTKTNSYSGHKLANQFIENLDLLENKPLRELAITPLFLHLACRVFLHQQKFPTKRSEFYKQCLDLLLSRWDETRGVERDEIYQSFLLPQKLKLLGQVATATFEQGDYFFEQHTVEQYICDYLRDLPNASTEPEELQLESEAILKAIELQHGLLAERVQGIFSFSHLTFQEYFTARKIVASCNLQASEQTLEQASEQPLEHLATHITDPRWREIFLLVITMLPNADALVRLIKQQIDAIVAEDPYLQEFLAWASQQSLATPSPAAVRAFHLALAHKPHLVPHLALASPLDQGILLNMVLDDLVQKCLAATTDFVLLRACVDALNNALIMVLDLEFHQALQCLKDQLPNLTKHPDKVQSWWQINAFDWTERLRAAIAQHHNISHDWHFSLEQQQLLQRYYDANQLLSDCLNSNCELTDTVRQELRATLLLQSQQR
ncbi:MAG: NACHT domain-containing NTPase [Timaviella obliquedivisa GSE-PSE-MK23-08B]|jgi:predicted NACHT family NTPase|nr:NACHT domain-containing NTPase [Timaviella obliquedivisa GSE-PSE-MK23-08B]